MIYKAILTSEVFKTSEVFCFNTVALYFLSPSQVRTPEPTDNKNDVISMSQHRKVKIGRREILCEILKRLFAPFIFSPAPTAQALC
jgi:hypothetical protein